VVVGRSCSASDVPEALPLVSDVRADDEDVDLDATAVFAILRVGVAVAVADSEAVLGVAPEGVIVGLAAHAYTRLPVDAASRATLAKCCDRHTAAVTPEM
jgi:hypothetical protein